ncbi:MAG TPA: hypothetical protein VIW24_04150 [Aldersonia sp.]
MTAPNLRAAAEQETAAEWLADLRWHREAYKQSRYQWDPVEPLLAATEFTRGRNEFTTLQDLRELAGHHRAALEVTATCQNALGVALKEARKVVSPLSWEPVAEELDLTVVECSSSGWAATWSEPCRHTNAQVANIQQMVDNTFYNNPLIRSWELAQLWLFYVAASDIIEDVLVDLVVELTDRRRPQDLADAIGMRTLPGLDHLVAEHRSRRGIPGDQRRTPQQYRTTV